MRLHFERNYREVIGKLILWWIGTAASVSNVNDKKERESNFCWISRSSTAHKNESLGQRTHVACIVVIIYSFLISRTRGHLKSHLFQDTFSNQLLLLTDMQTLRWRRLLWELILFFKSAFPAGNTSKTWLSETVYTVRSKRKGNQEFMFYHTFITVIINKWHNL